MEHSHVKKDKKNHPFIDNIEVLPEKIDELKKAVANHPTLQIKDEPEGERYTALLEKQDWTELSRMEVSDLNEAVNKYIQDHEETEDITSMQSLKDQLNLLRKSMQDG